MEYNTQIKQNCLKLGARLPFFKAQTTKGQKIFPKEYSGSWMVIFSYSSSFTPVSTTEFVEFARAGSDFRKMDCQLIGLSSDQVYIQLKWLQWIKSNLGVHISFPVISDPTQKIAESLGMIHPAHGDVPVGTVLVVDDNHVIRHIAHYPYEIGRNIQEVLRIVRALQTADRHRAGIPANWPESSLVGKSILLNPPKDEKAIEERMKKRNCFDWWFCYKRV